MQASEFVQVGMSAERTFQVDEDHTALRVGSGAFRVLATPSLVAFLERVAFSMLAERLPDGYSSVGVLVNARHLAPTPLGDKVRVRCEIHEIDGRRVTFYIQAWDEHAQVCEGEHQRVIVDTARFLSRVEARVGGAEST